MKNLIYVCAIMTTIGVHAQPTFEWAHQIGSTGTDQARSTATDFNNDIYFVGTFSNTADFDPGAGVQNLTSNGSRDGYVQKVDINGGFLWAHNIGSTGSDYINDVQVDDAGNVYLTGSFSGTVDFYPGFGVYNLTAVGSSDIFILKLDSGGNFIWAVSFGGVAADDPKSICVNNSNVYVTGYFNNTVDFDPGVGVYNLTSNGAADLFALQLDNNGTFQWAKSWGSIDNEFGGLSAIDSNGDIYVTYSFSSPVDFDPGAGTNIITPVGTNDGYILKLDASGNYLWVKTFGSSGNSVGLRQPAIDNLGNVIATGGFYGTVDFDPGLSTSNHTSNGLQDIVIVKLNGSGDYIWSKSFGGSGGDGSSSIAVDRDNSVYTTGEFREVVDFDPGPGFDFYSGGTFGSSDIYIHKLDESGNYEWTQTIVKDQFDETPRDISISEMGRLHITGDFNGANTDFDPGTGNYYLNPNGSTDAFVLDLCENISPSPDQAFLPDLSDECSVNAPSTPTGTNCAGTFSGTPDVTFPITTQGTTVVTWSFDNGSGNISTQTQNVIINDVTAPVADNGILSDINTECSVTSLTVPTATDNCAGSVNGTHNATLPITSQGTTVITWTYDDGNGNTSTQSQNVVINDATAPVADNGMLSDINAECSVSSLTAPTATDNCAGSVTGTHNATLPITSQGTTVVTWTYDDGNGNTTTQTQNVVINDVTAPVADVVMLSDINAECQISSLTAPTATDNCSGIITGTHNVSLPITAQGTTVVTWTYDDGNGNTSTQTQNVVISDVTAPVADAGMLSDIVTNCGQSVPSITAPTATDNCMGAITGTTSTAFPITSSTTVTWTYDDGNGNTSTQTQNVIINMDVTAPIADNGSLTPVSAECQVASIPAPTATDDCAGTVTGTPNVSFPITSQGTFTITWTYDDGNGNTSTQTQSVTIDDATDPVVDNVILPDEVAECEVNSLTAPTATDNCSGSITGTHNASLPITSQGTTVVTWTYDDGNGNTTTQTQNVVITDVTAPTADLVNLADINSECEVTPTAPTATDNCSGAITGTPDVSFPITSIGTTTITWTYDDGNGNTTTQTQDVIITPIDINTTTTPNATDYTISADASGYTYQWIEDCGNGNTVINGETNQSYTPATNGVYAVIIDNGACSDTSDCVIIDDLGIHESDIPNITLAPNPTDGSFTIALSSIYNSVDLTILDAQGKLITTEHYSNIENIEYTLSIEPGVYFLQLRLDGENATPLRVVKQ